VFGLRRLVITKLSTTRSHRHWSWHPWTRTNIRWSWHPWTRTNIRTIYSVNPLLMKLTSDQHPWTRTNIRTIYSVNPLLIPLGYLNHSHTTSRAPQLNTWQYPSSLEGCKRERERERDFQTRLVLEPCIHEATSASELLYCYFTTATLLLSLLLSVAVPVSTRPRARQSGSTVRTCLELAPAVRPVWNSVFCC